MKDTQIDFALPKSSKPKAPKHLGIMLAGILVAGSLVVAGAKINQALLPDRLPANQQCLTANSAAKDAVKQFSVQLGAALDGEAASAPDLLAVKNATNDCKANVSVYKVAEK